MDKRTGLRGRGHAYQADQARRALGISGDVPHLAAVPFPIVHAALGVAACAVAVALRPGMVGLEGSVIGVAALCVASGVALVVYDRLVYPPQARPPVEAVALPVAALCAFSLVLAANVQLGPRLLAAAVTVVVIGGLPHLGGLRATGHEGWGTRLLRDAAGVAVLVPVLLAGASDGLPLLVRAAVVLVGVGLVTLDGLQTEALTRRRSVLLAAVVGLAVTAVLVAMDRLALGTGERAAVTLIAWYGVRGVASGTGGWRQHLRNVAEYGVVVAIALLALSRFVH
ncbi:MAG: hypothetical protein ABSA40_01850 [Candidatus Dormibacteria bacterium]